MLDSHSYKLDNPPKNDPRKFKKVIFRESVLCFQVLSQFASSILLKGPLLIRSENKPAKAHQLYTEYINDDKLISKVENGSSEFEALYQLFNLESFLILKTSTNPPNKTTPTSDSKKNEEKQE
ncbi:MAG: hypothetical protein EZS28_031811 [Streblomastix strix]|uniref:Uncharacterized protein n=1 Tax=Streblomastix strix TaxID=222440 RepID=A0A5J4URI3_9EUKA|nr:MAG: hypothetical protein EZS28_031811 [Streblomastix strix]